MTSASNYSEPARRPAEERTVQPATADPPTGRVQPPELDRLPAQPPPDPDVGYLLHGRRPSPGEVRVIVRQRALQEIKRHSHSDREREVGGALLGHAYRHDGQTFVEVRAALPATTDDHGPLHFTFNADVWSGLHRARAERHPDLNIVGWFHTHPGLGVFFSADDVVVHSAAFVLPWHVGLVIDPERLEASFFGWVPHDDTSAREIAPLAGFYELLDQSEESLTPWKVVRTAVWEETYEEHLARRDDGRVETGPEQWPELPVISPWVGVAVGALALLLTAGLLLGFLGQRRQTQALADALTALAEQQLAAASAAGTAVCPNDALHLYAPLAGSAIAGGEEIAIVGTADHPDAARYALDIRPHGGGEWLALADFRRDVVAGTLAEWDSEPFAPGVYEMRLLALDREMARLAGVQGCTIIFELQ